MADVGRRLMLATPDAGLTKKDLKTLADHGYDVVVVNDLLAIRPADSSDILGHTELLRLAIEAMQKAVTHEAGESREWRALTWFRYKVTQALLARTVPSV